MAKVIITASVEDSVKWEKGFRTHGQLFKDYTSTDIRFTATEDNQVAIYWEVRSLERFLELVDSPRTVEAMEFDGVKRDTVQFFILDKEIAL